MFWRKESVQILPNESKVDIESFPFSAWKINLPKEGETFKLSFFAGISPNSLIVDPRKRLEEELILISKLEIDYHGVVTTPLQDVSGQFINVGAISGIVPSSVLDSALSPEQRLCLVQTPYNVNRARIHLFRTGAIK